MVRRTGPSGHGRRFTVSQVDRRCIDNSRVTTASGVGVGTPRPLTEKYTHNVTRTFWPWQKVSERSG